MTSEASDQNYDQVYNRLNERETDDLLKIWEENDRNVWAETAFSAIHDILQERLGSVPPQMEAHPIEIASVRQLIKGQKIISLSSYVKIAAWIVLVGFILAWIISMRTSFASITLLCEGLFFFMVLQILAEGLLLLLTIVENFPSKV